MKYKIKDVAIIVGVSIRTLQYYDKINLLKPEFLSEKGYRFYDDNNLERLQQILFFKELDFSLEEIKNILDNKNFDKKIAYEFHKNLLIKKKERLEQIIKTIDITINSINGENKMNKEEMFKVFDMNIIDEHKRKFYQESKERWGDSKYYKESEIKTSSYKKEDWERIMNEQKIIYQKFIDNMDKHVSDSIIQEAVKDWKQYITKNFYECTDEILKNLGDMYVSDERFSKNIDKNKEGLSEFLKNAFYYYCENIKN
jgi:DNA-binding transcriptional MerR regulator